MFVYKEEAELVQDREDLIAVLKMRFGDISSNTIEDIYNIKEIDALDRLILVAANAPGYDVFLEELSEGIDSFKIVGNQFNPIDSMPGGGHTNGAEK